MTACQLSSDVLVQHAVARDAGVVDQHVDRAEIGLDLGDARLTGVEVADVPAVGRDAGRRGERLGRRDIAAIGGGDRVAGLLECD